MHKIVYIKALKVHSTMRFVDIIQQFAKLHSIAALFCAKNLHFRLLTYLC